MIVRTTIAIKEKTLPTIYHAKDDLSEHSSDYEYSRVERVYH